ncbi:MAG TPA: hypothetical protein VKU42_03830, partial [Candidatus Angelobacter sp.]|nr:hypothetical protein [Candidatus Angelobacter sp.]
SNNVTSLINITNITANFTPVIVDSIPSLAISNSGSTNITVLWPASATGFNLYSAVNLLPASWQKITNPPSASNGVQQITLSNTNTSLFFRLSDP